MGQKNTKPSGIGGGEENKNAPPEVSFDDFEVLRAIGRGAFGKVKRLISTLNIIRLDNLSTNINYNNYVTSIFLLQHQGMLDRAEIYKESFSYEICQ